MNGNELDWNLAHRKSAVTARACDGQVPVTRGPVRTCVGCRKRAMATELLRVVVVDGELVPDVRRRFPGRGAWLHVDPGCLRSAGRRRAFPRALRVSGPLDVDALFAHLHDEK